jgi:steroid 5-alpha reductase family enzyme
LKQIPLKKITFQFLQVDTLKNILQFLNVEDLQNVFQVSQKSKSNCFKTSISKFFQTFYQSDNSLEYFNSKNFEAKQVRYAKILKKLKILKTVSLPNFIYHVLETPLFHVTLYTSGSFSIEKNSTGINKFVTVSLQDLFPILFTTVSERDLQEFRNEFSEKTFITAILNRKADTISLIFENGEIRLLPINNGSIIITVYDHPHLFQYICPHRTFFLIHYSENPQKVCIYHILLEKIFLLENSNITLSILNASSKQNEQFFKLLDKNNTFFLDDEFFKMNMMKYLGAKLKYKKSAQATIKF